MQINVPGSALDSNDDDDDMYAKRSSSLAGQEVFDFKANPSQCFLLDIFRGITRPSDNERSRIIQANFNWIPYAVSIQLFPIAFSYVDCYIRPDTSPPEGRHPLPMVQGCVRIVYRNGTCKRVCRGELIPWHQGNGNWIWGFHMGSRALTRPSGYSFVGRCHG